MEKSVDFLIIGGGIAGITAAETIRAQNAAASITVLGAEADLLYSRVLLPSYIKQRVKREQVFMRRIEDFDAKNIHVYSGEEVMAVNPERHDVTLRTGSLLRYGRLLIATGARVRQLPFAAADVRGVYRLQTIDDADIFYRALPSMRSAVVAGGGFIALEFLGILCERGIPATLITRDRRFFAKFISERGSAVIEDNFREKGIILISEDEVAGLSETAGAVSGVSTKKGSNISCDAVCVGIGVVRNNEFLNGSGIQVSPQGVATNEYLETSAPDVYAAGDVASFNDLALGSTHAVGTWNNAFLQGQAVGRIMAGERTPFINVASYSITNLGMHISVIGETDRANRSVIREDSAHRKYEEYYFNNGILKGAVLLNAAKDQPLVQKWIKGGKNFGSELDHFGDAGRELASFDT